MSALGDHIREQVACRRQLSERLQARAYRSDSQDDLWCGSEPLEWTVEDDLQLCRAELAHWERALELYEGEHAALEPEPPQICSAMLCGPGGQLEVCRLELDHAGEHDWEPERSRGCPPIG